MSLHPSLRIDSAGTQHRTVLTRIERIKDLMKKGQWKDGQNVTSLPKSKIMKIKAKKATKAEKEEGAAAPAASAAGAAPKAAAAPKAGAKK
ncbi:MAG TPA: small basic protein [Candidatus Bathyarchaeia archaeon]|nr:small basic protein [Candidatus Bathyarchaeia archaeon]